MNDLRGGQTSGLDGPASLRRRWRRVLSWPTVMVQFNFNERTIKAKVVYYGPAQSGKTTNLEQIHNRSDPAGTSRLISLNTAQDRTLFFDLLPFSLGAVAGYDFKVQLYTIPGQVQYNATRRVVLAGADAVVFVADARKSLLKENQAAFENMKVNLLANRLVPEKMPLVLQYNKQDLPDILTAEELDRVLNPWGRRTFPAVASAGTGRDGDVRGRGAGDAHRHRGQVQPQGEGAGPRPRFPASSPRPSPRCSPAGRIPARPRGRRRTSPPTRREELDRGAVDDAGRRPPRRSRSPPRPSRRPSPPAREEEPPPPRIVVSQFTDSLHAAPPRPTGRGDWSPRSCCTARSESSVELAEVLAELVRDMNLGLGTILSHAELLLLYKDEAREKRAAGDRDHPEEADAAARRSSTELGIGGGGVRAAPRRAGLSTTAPPDGIRGVPARRGGATGARPSTPATISVDLRIPAGTAPAQLPAPRPAPGAGGRLRGPGRRHRAPIPRCWCAASASRSSCGDPTARCSQRFPDGRPRPQRNSHGRGAAEDRRSGRRRGRWAGQPPVPRDGRVRAVRAAAGRDGRRRGSSLPAT